MHADRQRIAEDPALTAALRSAYTGSGDALDQLHWIDHPGQAGPSGAPDPAVLLRTLREEAFRPDPAAGALEAAAALDTRIRADRAAVLAAEAALLGAAAPSSPAATTPATDEPESAADRGPVRSRTRLLLAAVPVAAVLGLAAGALLGPRVGPIAPAPAATPHALVVFDRAARVADRPVDVTLPDFVQGARVRLLQIYPSIGMVAYGARTTDGRICLLTVILGTRSSAACVSEQAFADSGVSAVLVAEEDPPEGSTRASQDEIDLRWSPTGWISITPVPIAPASSSASSSLPPSASPARSGLSAS